MSQFLLLATKKLKESEMQSESEVEENESDNATSDEEEVEDDEYISRVCKKARTLRDSANTGFVK